MLIVVMMVTMIMCPVPKMEMGPSGMVTLLNRSSMRVGVGLPQREKWNDQ